MLTFHFVAAVGPGIETPAAIWSEPQALVVRGEVVLPQPCYELRGRLSRLGQDTIELALERFLPKLKGNEPLCPRSEAPVRYEARIAPLEGSWRVQVVDHRGTAQQTVADIRVTLPGAN